jgi:hypothetical protein
VSETNIGAKNGGDMCVIEGPEGIFFHIFSGAFVASRSPSELLINSLLNKQELNDDVMTTAKRAEVKPVNPRPIIRTLDVALQSDYHPLGFVPCPPNNRKPIPFETEVRRQHALCER